ncbi:nuclear envelope pore membrane protein POM 121-like [Erinaceus europaeus]|uniref:Nuclear envelope pore membrane protein POM 121-like n=1 Tax=Erinaceus europaeus TaxID=9365 RepID=A0ABM3XW33_ERIEU|nr:nuclear envelope pore membrane protein POM 121-like [Erinaceus europaeus]
MGGYLSQPPPQPSPLVVLDGGPPDNPEHLGQAHLLPAAWSPYLAPRLWEELQPPSPRRRRGFRRRGAPVQRRGSPSLQARCLFLGVLASAARGGLQRKPALWDCGARMLCTSVVLRLASAKGKLLLRLALQHTVTCLWTSLCVYLPSPYVKEALARALEKPGPPSLQSDEHPGTQEESRLEPGGHRGGKTLGEHCGASDGSQRPKSAFRRLMVHGVLSSFEPRPGPLKRDVAAQRADSKARRPSHSGAVSFRGPRNAITSSYSSTRGLPTLGGSLERATESRGPASPRPPCTPRRAPRTSPPPRIPASAQPTPRPASDPPVLGSDAGRRSSPDQGSRPRRRRTCLLLPARREDALCLPLPPQLGYGVTPEDMDAERRAAIQMINRILEG